MIVIAFDDYYVTLDCHMADTANQVSLSGQSRSINQSSWIYCGSLNIMF